MAAIVCRSVRFRYRADVRGSEEQRSSQSGSASARSSIGATTTQRYSLNPLDDRLPDHRSVPGGPSPEENKKAVEQGYRAQAYFDNVTMRGQAREVLEQLVREDPEGSVKLLDLGIARPREPNH
jgi:hypothetical protein